MTGLLFSSSKSQLSNQDIGLCQISKKTCENEIHKIRYLFGLDSLEYYSVSNSELLVVDSILTTKFREDLFIGNLEDYKGQYFGAVIDGEKMIFGTLYLNEDSNFDCNQITIIRGGGSSFNTFVIDLQDENKLTFESNNW